jgi:two-component system, cell cycle response regulator
VKVLIAEDNAVSRMLLEKLLLNWGYDVVQAYDGNQAWKSLQEDDSPRLVILDWMMPGMTGLDVCREVRKRIGRPYSYILLVTAREDKHDVIQGFEAGADDYLTKPFFPEELHARLRVGLRILELEDKLLLSQEVLQYKATHDELTGLLNRASITDILRRELARAQRPGRACGVLLADMDHFKTVNDTYGHDAGDAVLREAAIRLQAGIRDYDAVGRYGGEEFLIVLPGCEDANLRARAEHLLATFRERPFLTPSDSLPVTVSLGAASSTGLPVSALASLVRAADNALYAAKKNGRDRVEVAALEDSLNLAPDVVAK